MAQESQGIIAYWSTTTAVATAAANVVGEVVGFNGPNINSNIIDVTHLRSTAKEKLVGLYDAGELSLSVNFMATNAGQVKVRESLAARTLGCLMLQLSSASTTQKITQKGYCNGLSITGAVDDKISGDFSFALTKGVIFTT